MAEVVVRVKLDWARDGEEWMMHLHSLIAIGGLQSFGSDREELSDLIQCEASDPRLHSHLHVMRGTGGRIECTIVENPAPDGEQQFADQIGPWRDAVLQAADLVGTFVPASWNAVLGPRPRARTGWTAFGADLRPSALAAECLVGPLRLVPAGVLMHEMPDAHPDRIGEDRFAFSSWPMIIEGSAASFGENLAGPVALWPMDHQGALRAAQRSAALLSLAWDECWIVRQGPVRISPGARVTVPHLAAGHQLGRSPWAEGCAEPARYGSAGRRERDLPEWLEPAWSVLDAEPELDGALSAHYEALQLEDRHPSTAFMLYVTAIERIGAGQPAPQRCETCNMLTGAAARFRAALCTVMTLPEAKALAKTAYERRSRTAHQGTLHGAENTLGQLPDSDFRTDDAERFEDDELTTIRQCTREVLIQAFAATRSK